MTRDKVIRRAAERLAFSDPDRTMDEHERYVREVLTAIDEHLVLRSLYDAVVRQLRPLKP